jgi:hypothetical protein
VGEVTGGWRKLLNEELRDLYSSPSIRIMKARRKSWVGHVARISLLVSSTLIYIEIPSVFF